MKKGKDEPQVLILTILMVVTAVAEMMAGFAVGLLFSGMSAIGIGIVANDPSIPDPNVALAIYGALGAMGFVQGAVATLVAGLVAWGAYNLHQRRSLAAVYVGLFAALVFGVGTGLFSLVTCQCSMLMLWMPALVMSIVSAILGVVVLANDNVREQFGFSADFDA